MVTATKTNQGQSSHLTLTVTNGAGLVTTCDPVVPAAKTKHVAARTRHTRSSGSGLAVNIDVHVVLYSSAKGITLSGKVPSGQAGQTVTVLSQACGFTARSPIANLKTGAGDVLWKPGGER